MVSAVKLGLVKEAVVTAAAYRGVLQRMRQGDFDPASALVVLVLVLNLVLVLVLDPSAAFRTE